MRLKTPRCFSLAVEQGAEGVELDVQFTRDKHIIVTHDERRREGTAAAEYAIKPKDIKSVSSA